MGLSACLVFWGTKVTLPTMGVKVYHVMAVAVLILHLLWILWLFVRSRSPAAGARGAGCTSSLWCTVC